MKTFTKIIMPVALAAILSFTPSCAVFQKPGTKVTGDQSKITAVDKSSGKKTEKKKVAASATNKSQKNKKTKAKKTAKQQSQASVTPSKPAADNHGSLNGEWTLIKVRDTKLTGDERPYIYFDNSTGRFYGSNSCNILNGDFNTAPNGGIKFSGVIASMKLCHDTPYEFIINAAIDEVTGYRISRSGDDESLLLLNKDGKTILELNRHNIDFLNGAWKVISIDGTPVTAERMRLSLDIPELKIHGNAGCNILNGTLFVDPDKPNAIQFQQLSTTRMACPDIQQETALLVALEEVTSAYRYGESGVVLRNNSGKDKIILERIDRSEITDNE